VEHAVSGWLGKRPQIVSLSPNRLADIWDDIRRVAEVLDSSNPVANIAFPEKPRCCHHEKTCIFEKPSYRRLY